MEKTHVGNSRAYASYAGEQGFEHSIDLSVLRLAMATYLLGQMMDFKMESKEAKVKAAFEYADLLLKG